MFVMKSLQCFESIGAPLLSIINKYTGSINKQTGSDIHLFSSIVSFNSSALKLLIKYL